MLEQVGDFVALAGKVDRRTIVHKVEDAGDLAVAGVVEGNNRGCFRGMQLDLGSVNGVHKQLLSTETEVRRADDGPLDLGVVLARGLVADGKASVPIEVSSEVVPLEVLGQQVAEPFQN